MKRLSLVILSIASAIALVGCSCTAQPNGNSGGGGGSNTSTSNVNKNDITVNFYADFNQVLSKNVFQSYTVHNGDKLTKPTNNPEAPYPEFPVFLGWSAKEIIDDKADLWDFENDYVDTAGKTWNMYGIWVAQGES